jgi:hypothetical protein
MKRVLGSSGGTALQFSAQRKPLREKLVARLGTRISPRANSGTGYRRSSVRSRRVPFAAEHPGVAERSLLRRSEIAVARDLIPNVGRLGSEIRHRAMI